MISSSQLPSGHVRIAGILHQLTRVQELLMLRISPLMMPLFLDVLTGRFPIKIFSLMLTVLSLVLDQVVGSFHSGDI